MAQPTDEDAVIYRQAVDRAHQQVTAARPLVRRLATLHAPTGTVHEEPYCTGCDQGGSGDSWSYPVWPCSTYDVLAAHAQVALPTSPWPSHV